MINKDIIIRIIQIAKTLDENHMHKASDDLTFMLKRLAYSPNGPHNYNNPVQEIPYKSIEEGLMSQDKKRMNSPEFKPEYIKSPTDESDYDDRSLTNMNSPEGEEAVPGPKRIEHDYTSPSNMGGNSGTEGFKWEDTHSTTNPFDVGKYLPHG